MSSLPKDPYKGKAAYGLFSNNKLELYSLYALGVLGIFFRMFFAQENDMVGIDGPATSTLWGYGITAIATLCILFIMYGLSNRELMNSKNVNPDIKDGFMSNIGYILKEGNIFVLILIVLTFILTLNYAYFEKINVGIMPTSFNRFNTVSNILMIIQFLILFQFINLRMLGNNSKKQIVGIITATSYFLSTLNVIFVIIMYILLKYFSTDG